MPWETFTRPARSTVRPMVTVAASGHYLTLNRAAFAAIGRPAAVVLLWDAATRTIGLQAAGPDEVDCYSVTRIGTAGKVTARAFLRYYNLVTGETRQLAAEMRDGVLCVSTEPPGGTP